MARRKTKRRRRRSPKKKRTYRRRTKASGKKRKTRGLSGKIGAVILGVIPSTLAGISAVSKTMSVSKQNDLDIMSSVQYGVMQFCNELSNGFLAVIPFKETSVGKKDGSRMIVGMGANLPKGSLWSVAGVGMLMLAYDWIAAKLAGGETKIPMTNFAATGSR